MPRSTPYDDPRLMRARALATGQGGVLSRPQLFAAGVRRWEITAQLRLHRWRRLTDQAVCLHNGDVSPEGHAWAAVLTGGPRARLDGVSALAAAGLRNFSTDQLRVSVPRGARVRRTPHYDIRQTRRWRSGDLAAGAGVPRTQPAVAAVHGALWAQSDRQAELLLTMAVQQGLVRVPDLAAQLLLVRRHRRRSRLHGLVLELAGGVRSLGELDVLRGCRERGLPVPDRQVLRRTHRGSYYLDLHWSGYGVTVEVDGIQHAWAENLIADALRHNEVAIGGEVVLRLPLMGLRVCPDEFFGQIEQALLGRGWLRGAA